MGNNDSGRRKDPVRYTWVFVLCAVFLVALCCVLYAIDRNLQSKQKSIVNQSDAYKDENVFPDGVFVDGISIGNFTSEQARQILLDEINFKRKQQTVTVIFHSEAYPIRLQEDMVTHNLEDVLDQAMQLGKQASDSESVSYLKELPYYPVYFSLTLQVDPSGLEEEVKALAETLSAPAINASVSSYDPEKEEGERFSFHAESCGSRVDPDWLWENVKREFTDPDDRRLEIVESDILPEISVRELQTIRYLQAQFCLRTEWNEAQTENLDRLCDELNGTILMPGDVFSWNEVIGECTQEEGYRSDGTVDAVANLASTAAMNAALLSGMRIEDRSPNLQNLSYVERGRESLVNKDEDLVFRNTTDSCMILTAYRDKETGAMTAEFYGKAKNVGESIDIETEIDEILPFPKEVQYVASAKLEPGQTVRTDGRDGCVCTTYRVYTFTDGRTRREKVFAAEYAPTPERVYYCSEDESPQQ